MKNLINLITNADKIKLLKNQLGYAKNDIALYKAKLDQLISEPPKEVILKDPHGLIQADLVKLERFLDTKPYKIGDTIDEVAYKAGQQTVLRVIKEKLIAPATGRLT